MVIKNDFECFFCFGFSDTAEGRMLLLVTAICLIVGTVGQGDTLEPLNPQNLNPDAIHDF